MATGKIEFRCNGAFKDATERRRKSLGFKTTADYFRSLARYDFLIKKEHAVTAAVAELPLDEQEVIDRSLLEFQSSAKGKRGQLLEHIVERAIKKAKTDVDPERVKAALPEVLRSLALGKEEG